MGKVGYVLIALAMVGYAVAVLFVVLALVGLAGRDTAARPLVIVAVAVWAMFVVGVTLGIGASRDDFPVGTGFWVQATCAGIAIVGMLVLLLVSDRAASPAVDTASDGMRT
jgi:hypothetical protein